MTTIEQGRVVSASDAEFTVNLFGRKGEWRVPLRNMGKLAYDEEGPKIEPPSVEEEAIIPKEGSLTVVAMDWEPELGKAVCWAPFPDAVVVRTTS